MTMVLGDLKWLTDNIHNFDKKAEVVVIIMNGIEAIKLPILEVTFDEKLVIKCELPQVK